MRRSLFAVLMVMSTTASLSAQRRPRVYITNDPGVWASAAVSGFRANEVNDGATGSNWNFGNATNAQYRLSLEKGLSSGSSIGIAGSYANVPFVYSADLSIPLPSGASGARCSNAAGGGCDSHLNLMTLVGTFHYGSGVGLHQVIELNGGIVSYQNLKRDSDGAKLAGSGNIDPLLDLGYGFGYGLNDRTNIDVISDYGFALHERSGLSNSAGNTNSMPGLRVSLRMGFGSRSVRR
jgi:hypothetical protein